MRDLRGVPPMSDRSSKERIRCLPDLGAWFWAEASLWGPVRPCLQPARLVAPGSAAARTKLVGSTSGSGPWGSRDPRIEGVIWAAARGPGSSGRRQEMPRHQFRSCSAGGRVRETVLRPEDRTARCACKVPVADARRTRRAEAAACSRIVVRMTKRCMDRFPDRPVSAVRPRKRASTTHSRGVGKPSTPGPYDL